MELLHNFGIEPVLLIAQVINFLIVLYILKRFLYKPLFSMLQNREQTIKTGLEQAEEARKLLDEAGEKEREILKKAQSEAKILFSDAKKQASDMLIASEEKTRQQTERMLTEAREQITAETRDAEKRLTQQISRLAIEYLQKSVDELFADQDQEKVMNRALQTLKKKAD